MSVTSSRTPARLLNSCSTPSILIEVTAAPWSEDRSTRRSELPSVIPNPRSSGSATNTARRISLPLAFFSSALGFFSSCQFFALTAMFIPWQLGAWWKPLISVQTRHSRAGGNPAKSSDSPPLARPDPVVRDRGHIADAGDREADRLQCPKRAFAARSRPLDLDFERSDAMVG